PPGRTAAFSARAWRPHGSQPAHRIVRSGEPRNRLWGPPDFQWLGRIVTIWPARARPWQLVGADDLEVLVDEDVVWPVDADVVDLVFAVAQLHNTVDNAPWVGGQRSFSRLIGCRPADDRSRPLTVVRWDLADLL